ncbi:rab-GTPase-TBC domain-containing protein, partial [Syncephalis pseudoplumigaleata]
LRRLALVHPIPAGHDELRRRLWRSLLACEGHFAPLQRLYPGLEARGPSSLHQQIRHDLSVLTQSDRFLSSHASDAQAQACLVDTLERMLNAFVHQMQDEQDVAGSYVQGLHWIALAFVEVLPDEAEAFAAFSLFITRCAPVYARATMDGLMDECLRILDRPLYEHLLDHGIFPERYAYNALLSFTGCRKVISQQDHLRLWDVFLAHGIHINVLCVVAQLIHARDVLL